ncbi:MAG: NADH-ubiquinone oxidoreductase-F iron-sulfur binding region domain-containing protein [Ilumatobacteraceae bacterium]
MAMRAPASGPDVVVHRVLPIGQHRTLDDYVAAGGGAGRHAALDADAVELIDLVRNSGLRGRGGAGFPTGIQWSTVAGLASESLPTTVVVNGAEGEPGTFKDRAILRANPYAVLEGAVIAARAVGAPTAVIALKSTFVREIERVQRAIAEMEAAGWVDRGVLTVFEGPREYLFGEETALLESIAGRPPFPRIAPPWRRGATEVVEDVEDTTSESGLAAPVLMAGETEAPPALVNNVETIANVPGIIANGADWFRSLGTAESPGTIVCTVSGSTKRAGVAEIPMGTPLRDAIEAIGGGVDVGRRVTAVLLGVANAALTGDQLDTPLCYEAMRDAGSGLGSAGAIVFTDDDDLLAAAAGVARFLAVESCGQCTPCKQDGLALAARLTALCAGAGEPDDAATVSDLLATVADGARCALAGQQQTAVGSLVALAGGHPRPTADGEAIEPMLVAELVDLDDGKAVYDVEFPGKQPDWTYDAIDSGQSPVDRLTDKRAD